jgi:hypothetical protein
VVNVVLQASNSLVRSTGHPADHCPSLLAGLSHIFGCSHVMQPEYLPSRTRYAAVSTVNSSPSNPISTSPKAAVRSADIMRFIMSIFSSGS